MHSVIFICTANRCRSPIAKALMMDKLKKLALADDWQVESAGTWAEEGQPILDGARVVMSEKGFDLTGHRSLPVTRDLLRPYQLILAMESGQKEAIKIEFPDLAGRVYLLSEMAGLRGDVRDPASKSLAEFREVANEIESLLNRGFDRITTLAQDKKPRMTVEEIIRQLTRNAEAVRSLLQTISDEQANWKPKPETWSLKEVMGHLYQEERLDFRQHLREMLSDPPQPWGVGQPEAKVVVESLPQALAGFLDERAASLAWLRSLEAVNWEIKTPTPFSPGGAKISLSAGDVLISWAAHDYLHIRQINELLFAWNEKEGFPFSVDYAGGW